MYAIPKPLGLTIPLKINRFYKVCRLMAWWVKTESNERKWNIDECVMFDWCIGIMCIDKKGDCQIMLFMYTHSNMREISQLSIIVDFQLPWSSFCFCCFNYTSNIRCNIWITGSVRINFWLEIFCPVGRTAVSANGYPPMSVLDMTLNNLMVRFQ